MAIISYLIALIVLLSLLYFCHRIIIRYFSLLAWLIFGKNEPAAVFYFLLFLPGIILHELSHFFMASALGVSTGRIIIFPEKTSEQGWSLGRVDSAKTDVFRSGLIGLAPILIGTVSLFFIFNVGLGTNSLRPFFLSEIKTVQDLFSLSPDWRTVIWFYLVIVFANTMFLSKEDRASIWVFPGLLLGFFLLAKFLGQASVLVFFEDFFSQITFPLLLSFSLTAGLDFLLILILALLAALIGKIKR